MNDLTNSTVFFPGAGSFGSEFQPLMDALRPAAWLVRYPGRSGRSFGVPASSFDEVVRDAAGQITSRLPMDSPLPRGLVLFGHSFGAYVAYATALRLQESGIGVSALVAAGAAAPRRRQVPEQATGSPSDAVAYLESIDPGALDDAPSEEWCEIVAETVVSDMRLLRQFDAALSDRLHCPVLVARGAADPLTSDAGVGEWGDYTDSAFLRRVFPGGHSGFLRSRACASWVREIRESFTSHGRHRS